MYTYVIQIDLDGMQVICQNIRTLSRKLENLDWTHKVKDER